MSDKSRTKKGYSRVIQVVRRGKRLKDFDEEVIREDESESSVANGLIDDGLKYRQMERKMLVAKHPFFSNSND